MADQKEKKTLVKDALALCVITIVAGFLLSFFYELTKEPIEAAKLEAKVKAYQSVFSEAADFTENQTITDIVKSSKEALDAAGFENVTIEEVLEAKDTSDSKLGYVMSIIGHGGYGGDITLSVGIDLEGVIKGVEVLSMSETPGLGAKCTTPEFKDQFAGKQAEAIRYTSGEKTSEDQIDAISGATITTSAVTDAVNAGLYLKNHVMEGKVERNLSTSLVCTLPKAADGRKDE